MVQVQAASLLCSEVPEGQRGACLALGPGRERSDEECCWWDLAAPWEGWHQLCVQGMK